MLSFEKYLKIDNCILLESLSSPSRALGKTYSNLEDLVVEEGKEGAFNALETITNLTKKLRGQEVNIDVKTEINGSLSFLIGRDIRKEYKNQFFIALQNIIDSSKNIIREGARMLHSEEEIIEVFGYKPSLSNSIVALFKELNRAYDNSGNIYLCESLFTSQEEKELQQIDGENYLTFKPNNISYAIPVDDLSDNFKLLNKSKVGIVIKQGFKPHNRENFIHLSPLEKRLDSIENSAKRAGVFAINPQVRNVFSKINNEKLFELDSYIQETKELVEGIDDSFNEQYVSSQVMEYLKLFISLQLESPKGGIFCKEYEKKHIPEFLKEFKRFLHKRIERKNKKRTQNLVNFLEDNYSEIFLLVNIFHNMLEIKKLLISIVEDLNVSLKKFYRASSSGILYPVKGEGIVVYNRDSVVKIVDRLELFSVNS